MFESKFLNYPAMRVPDMVNKLVIADVKWCDKKKLKFEYKDILNLVMECK